MDTIRIFMIGVGGQGTLTATTLLTQTALDHGLEVTSGEIHGMAQRGGVVVSTVMLGGLKSPVIGKGEADVLLGFEPLETYRGLEHLRPGGLVVSSSETVAPVSVSMGRAEYPAFETIRTAVEACAGRALFLPIRTMGKEAGAVQSGNLALLGAVCATGALPFGPEALESTLRSFMKPALLETNLKALALGVDAVRAAANV